MIETSIQQEQENQVKRCREKDRAVFFYTQNLMLLCKIYDTPPSQTEGYLIQNRVEMQPIPPPYANTTPNANQPPHSNNPCLQ